MKIKPVVIGMVAWLLLPLAGANAPAVSDPGLNQAGAGADLQRGAVHPAENFGRKENEDKGDDGAKDDKDRKRHHCDDGDHSDSDHGDHGDHGDRGDRGDDCEKSPSKPHH
jgi:hypothetical protein